MFGAGAHVQSIGDNAVYIGDKRSAYFRVDSPEMLDFMTAYLAKRAPVSTVVVRPITRGSPNTSPLRGSPPSPTRSAPDARRKNKVEPFTLDTIDELQPSETVKLSDGKVQITVDASSLVGYLQNARMQGKSIFDVDLSAVDEQGQSISIDFTSHELWLSCICRGHDEAATFRKMFMDGAKAVELHQDALEDLRNDHPDLWYKVLFFARDLLRLGRNEGGPVERLEDAQRDPNQHFFFSSTYFGDGLPRILDMPGPTGPTLRDTLRHIFSNSEGGEVCSSHTLFPLVNRFFRFRKDVWEQREFKRKYADFEKAWEKQKKKAGKAGRR
ncbi:hypothetical protein C8T65DRAFT_642527 [Cerioporus squamosus]|nr:hypothetical protein C8T65DRAFT_642527 [Cerioporus squamosus]